MTTKYLDGTSCAKSVLSQSCRMSSKKLEKKQCGFTLLEVLVALVIVGVALGASLRALGSLTQNSEHLRNTMMAMWSAENRLSQIRLATSWPDIGRSNFPCPQDNLPLVCFQEVVATPNPSFRRVEVSVVDERFPDRKLIKLTQVVPNAL